MNVRLPLLLALLFVAAPVLAGKGPLQVFTYHDVVKELQDGKLRDEMAVTTRTLTEHFRWLREQGYQPVSIDQMVAANNGGPPLPDKPVLLTFDDGLRSVYTDVFPLLKLFDYPAVVSVVTSWLENDVTVRYAGRERGNEDFLTWAQIREMQASGLVEIASHSHAMHQGGLVNRQGNTQPVAVARLFLNGRYESDEDRRQRLRQDLQESVSIIAKHTGIKPRVMIWPYGAYNYIGLQAAGELGLDWSGTLDPNYGNPLHTKTLHRHLIKDDPNIREFSSLVLKTEDPPLVRVAQVDLDFVFDPDPVQQERNLDVMIERMAQLRISHVYLQAFSDLDGDGAAEALYFPNRHLPMRADLFNRAAWQLKTRAEVTVFAWMPMLSFTGKNVDAAWRVLQETPDGVQQDPATEPRLSPFNPDARNFIAEIYQDLARHAQFEGLHFHDDGRFNKYEDASSASLLAYHDLHGTYIDLATMDERPADAKRWAEFKATALIEFTDELAGVVRPYQPRLQTSRNLFAPTITDAEGTRLLAQDYTQFLDNYDFVTVLAMPLLEQADASFTNLDFYQDLADKARLRDPALGRTVFQLQTVDPLRREPIPDLQLKNMFRKLQTIGVRSLAYYPDNFLENQPDLGLLRQGISVAEDLLRGQP